MNVGAAPTAVATTVAALPDRPLERAAGELAVELGAARAPHADRAGRQELVTGTRARDRGDGRRGVHFEDRLARVDEPVELIPSLNAIWNSPPGQRGLRRDLELRAALARAHRLHADRDDVLLGLLARDRAREQDVGLHVLVVGDDGLDLLLALAAAVASVTMNVSAVLSDEHIRRSSDR